MIEMEPVVTAMILLSITFGLVVLTAVAAVGWEFAPAIRRHFGALRSTTGRLVARHSYHAPITH